MRSKLTFVVAFVFVATGIALPALAQKQGGTLRIYHRDNAPSGSIHEEATISTVQPFMGVFNNLVVYDQAKPLNSADTIVPDLAESWAWDATKTKLTFKLRQGVKWHDGKPFTAKDVQCTWNKLTAKDPDAFRKNPRAVWWQNLKEVTVNGDHEATFVLNRPQPSFLSLFAPGYTPVYPCHVSTKDMRTNPIGTGPFKFVEWKRNETINFVRNPDYWKKGLPHVDAIEWRIIPNRSTRILAFVAGEFDMTFSADVTIPCSRMSTQAPKATCELCPVRLANLIINPAAALNEPKIRKAMSLAIDRKAFIDTLRGQGHISGVMLLPQGLGDAPTYRRFPATADVEGRVKAQDHGRARLRRGQAAQGQGLDAQHCHLPRSGRHPHRPAQEDLHRGRAGGHRHQHLARQGDARRVFGRAEPDRRRRGRPRRQSLRELQLQLRAQPDQVLQQGRRARSTSSRGGRVEAQKIVWEIERKLPRTSPGRHLYDRRDLLAAAVKGFVRTRTAFTTTGVSTASGWTSR
jgi:hypothetical protein